MLSQFKYKSIFLQFFKHIRMEEFDQEMQSSAMAILSCLVLSHRWIKKGSLPSESHSTRKDISSPRKHCINWLGVKHFSYGVPWIEQSIQTSISHSYVFVFVKPELILQRHLTFPLFRYLECLSSNSIFCLLTCTVACIFTLLHTNTQLLSYVLPMWFHIRPQNSESSANICIWIIEHNLNLHNELLFFIKLWTLSFFSHK